MYAGGCQDKEGRRKSSAESADDADGDARLSVQARVHPVPGDPKGRPYRLRFVLFVPFVVPIPASLRFLSFRVFRVFRGSGPPSPLRFVLFVPFVGFRPFVPSHPYVP